MSNSSKLSPTQELVLRNAVKRGGAIMPLPDKLPGGAKKKVFDSLLNKGFVDNLPASEGSDSVIYQITNEGREAIGEVMTEVAPERKTESETVDVKEVSSEPTDEETADVKPDAPTEAEEEVQTTEDASETEQGDNGAEESQPSPEFKPLRGRARELAGMLLTSKEGITATEIGENMGLQTHSVRGMISRDIKKKGGHTVITGKNDRGECTYRIDKEAA